MNLKKTIVIALAATALFASFGCGSGGEKKTPSSPHAAETKQEKTVEEQKQDQKLQEQQPPTVKNKLENIVFELSQYNMPGGKLNLIANITNNNSEGITIKEAIIAVELRDMNGDFIWSDWAQFDNVNLYIPARETRRHEFIITNSNCPSYDGGVHCNVNWIFGK